MPTRAKILKVFVASPSDVVVERNKVNSIIEKVNKEIGSNSGIRLETVKWETDTAPGTGEYVQGVISDQIDDYDIFIGIFWKKFGTPTKYWKSGTQEEFENAYTKNSTDYSTRIMIYFSEKPIDQNKVNKKQYKLVKDFQASLGERGVFWSTYKSNREFEEQVRSHLHKIVNEFKKTKKKFVQKPKSKKIKPLKNLGAWELLFEHDENGKQIEGSLDNLITAVYKGAAIRLRIHHSDSIVQTMDVPLLTIENKVVHASNISQISSMRNQDGNHIYQENPYHYYLIVNSNGYFHARRIFLDGNERSVTTSKKHMAWIALMPKN